MATTVMEQTKTDTSTPGPDLTEAFVADRQAFWSSFTNFVLMGVLGLAVLLILLAFFLT